jgi:hypothetical protein
MYFDIQKEMDKMMLETFYCAQEAELLHDYLSSNLTEEIAQRQIKIQHRNPIHYTTRWDISGKSQFGGISVSVPTGTMGNRLQDGVGPYKRPGTYEIALLDAGNDLVYVDELGYDDVRCFYSHKEVFDEIKRLIDVKGSVPATTASNSAAATSVSNSSSSSSTGLMFVG